MLGHKTGKRYLKSFKSKCSISTKLQSLHYRIINRYIPTRKFLAVRGIVGSPLCVRCLEPDDLKHFFFECESVKPLWNTILPQLKAKYNLRNDFLHYETVLLGYPQAPPIVNLILLLVKQYIVNRKLNKDGEEEPSIEGAKMDIINFCYAEGMLAVKRNRIQAHKEKWKFIWSSDVPLGRPTSVASAEISVWEESIMYSRMTPFAIFV